MKTVDSYFKIMAQCPKCDNSIILDPSDFEDDNGNLDKNSKCKIVCKEEGGCDCIFLVEYPNE